MVLRELNLDFALVRTLTGDEAHLQPDYLAINPVGRVPALRTDDGEILTEVTAILRYLARGAPETGLYPTERWAAARCDEILSRIASVAQPSNRLYVRPDRFARGADEASLDVIRTAASAEFCTALDHLERDLPVSGWAVGDHFTVADPYLTVMWLWARYNRQDLERWPRLGRIAGEVLGRRSARACFVAEGLVDEAGRTTRPTRV